MKKRLVIGIVLVSILLIMPLASAQECTDSDGGIDYYVRGKFSGMYQGTLITNTEDSCLNAIDETGDEVDSSDYLGEGYCEDGELKVERITCSNGCQDGACLKEQTPEPNGGDSGEVVSAAELSDMIIMEDVGNFKFVDSDMSTLGIDADVYLGTYKIESPIEGIDFINFGVEIRRPKTETAEEMFDKKLGRLTEFMGVNYKIVKQKTAPEFSYVEWFSGEYFIKLGPGTTSVDLGMTLGYMEDLVIAYGEKYPSDVELRDACEQIGLRRPGGYCSDTGVYVEQKTDGQYCDNHFECRSNICTADECVSLNLIQKIIAFFKNLFGG